MLAYSAFVLLVFPLVFLGGAFQLACAHVGARAGGCVRPVAAAVASVAWPALVVWMMHAALVVDGAWPFPVFAVTGMLAAAAPAAFLAEEFPRRRVLTDLVMATGSFAALVAIT